MSAGKKMKKVTIIGTGLIGCSAGMALRKNGYIVTGYDNSKHNLKVAQEIGAIDNIKHCSYEATEMSHAMIITIPVDDIIRLLPRFLDFIPEDSLIIDAGSTKVTICKSISNHPKRHAFVASHPMAGTEHSGPAMATQDLFYNKNVVICEKELSSSKALGVAEELFTNMGMNIIYLSPQDHDMTAALVSHLPQILAYLYAGMPEFTNEKKQYWQKLAAGGFDSFTRLAHSAPEIWLPILSQNKEFITNILYSLSKSMALFAEKLEEDNLNYIEQVIKKARIVRENYKAHKDNYTKNSINKYTEKL